MKERNRADRPPQGAAVAIAALLSLVWLAGIVALLWTLGGDGAVWLAVAVAVALPLVAIWLAALLARQSAELRSEADRLTDAAEALRRAADATTRQAAPSAPIAAPQPPLQPPMQPAGRPPLRLSPDTPRARTPRQQSLPLAVEAEAPQVAISDLARALDFPDSAEDVEGFRALHLALNDPRARRLVQASQDILTLLSEEGIYMDDLDPDRTTPEVWRRFASGERGATVAKVGGIRDRSSLALTATRMRNDPVFRDVAHHFLRLFDQTLAEIAPNATDAELAALAETRTARAFMVTGRVAGIFE